MKIEEVLYKLMMEELASEEREVLEKLLSEQPEYQKIYTRLQNRKNLKRAYQTYQKANTVSAWRKNMHLRHKVNSRRVVMKIVGVAASIAILFVVLLLWKSGEKAKENVQIAQTKIPISIPKGNIQVIVESDSYTIQDTVELKERENILSEETKELQVIVGRGNMFHFRLPDGSEVYMNAESEISYPGKFKGDTREIHVSGEVYLNVVKDTARPFLVYYGGNNAIEVLGTSFNVKAYPEQVESFVTLISGSVQFHSSKELIRMEPAQQLVFNKRTGSALVQDVDTELYTAWMNNRFSFKYETLENISQELSRWYGVKFKFENHAQKRFSGGFSKYDNIEKILKLLAETTQINFVVQDSCIIVK